MKGLARVKCRCEALRLLCACRPVVRLPRKNSRNVALVPSSVVHVTKKPFMSDACSDSEPYGRVIITGHGLATATL